MIQGGDFTKGDGTGGERYVEPEEAVPHSEPAHSSDDAAPSLLVLSTSIYGLRFKDENFKVSGSCFNRVKDGRKGSWGIGV